MEQTKKIITGETDSCQYSFKIGFTKFSGQAPYFSITGETWELGRPKIDKYSLSCGSLNIGYYFPELAHLDKYHLMSIKEPMHYVANSLYHASNRDHWGLLKGEKRQIKNGKTGQPCWTMVAIDKDGNEVELYTLNKYKDAETQPEDEGLTVQWRPLWRVGEGKEPDLEAARRSACWPEARLEDFTEEKLRARLPELLKQFRHDVEAAGIAWPVDKD